MPTRIEFGKWAGVVDADLRLTCACCGPRDHTDHMPTPSNQQQNPRRTPVEPQPRHLWCPVAGDQNLVGHRGSVVWCHGSRRGGGRPILEHDKGDAHMLRRAAVITAGLAMATSFGLAGAGVASAAAPTLKIKPNAIWTLEVKHMGVTRRNSTRPHTRSSRPITATLEPGSSATARRSDDLDEAGGMSGHNFGGRFVSTTTPVEYKGSYNGDPIALKAKLVKGAVATFNGATC